MLDWNGALPKTVRAGNTKTPVEVVHRCTFARLRASRVCFSSPLSLTDSEGGEVSNTLRLAAD